MKRCMLGGRCMAIITGIGVAMTGGRSQQEAIKAVTLAAIIVLGIIGAGGWHPSSGPRCSGVAAGTFGA